MSGNLVIGLPYLKKLVADEIETEGPGFVYRPTGSGGRRAGRVECVNVEPSDGGWVPSCLIGRVMWHSGIVPHDQIIGSRFAGVAAFRQYFSKEAASYATHLQNGQDSGKTWEEAVKYADRVTKYLIVAYKEVSV